MSQFNLVTTNMMDMRSYELLPLHFMILYITSQVELLYMIPITFLFSILVLLKILVIFRYLFHFVIRPIKQMADIVSFVTGANSSGAASRGWVIGQRTDTVA